MSKKDIQEYKSAILKHLSDGRMRHAIAMLKSWAEEAMMWEITDKVNSIESNYSLMLSYLISGMDDPQRNNILSSMNEDMRTFADIVERKRMSVDAPTLYFSNVRTSSMKPGQSLSSLLSGFEEASTPEQQNLAEQIFTKVWTQFPFKQEDEDVIGRVLNIESNYPAHLKVLVASALVLGQMTYYDEARLRLLIETYTSFDETEDASLNPYASYIGAISAIGFFLSSMRYPERIPSSSLKSRIEAMRDNPHWQSRLRTIAIEWIRVIDTERINKKMMEELIPGFMKLRPDVLRKINLSDTQLNDLQHITSNPEWEDILRESGLESKLREFSEIQQEGGDVFMSTFSNLKHFPFFNSVTGWFLPFDSETPQIRSFSDNSTTQLAILLEGAPFLCDSDKYSFLLSLSMIPESQKEMMRAQIDAQAQNLAEAAKSAENSLPNNIWKSAVSRFLHNLYRFHKLFRRKSEFFDPFDPQVIPTTLPMLAADLSDTETIEMLAEMYFRFGLHPQAFNLFNQADASLAPDATRYQKMGFCKEMLGDPQTARDLYEKADILSPDSPWTIRRLAVTARATHNYPMALRHFMKLQEIYPDDPNIALQTGFVYTEAGDYAQAKAQFHKAEFLNPDSSKAWRGLAWTQFLTKDFDNADKYYSKILQHNPSAEDYLNMGHVALAKKEYKEAINFYRLWQSNSTKNNIAPSILDALNNDIEAIKEAGIDYSLIPLIADEAETN